MSVWPRGLVTGTPSRTSVEVDGMPRHIADVRQAERSHVQSPDEEEIYEEEHETSVRHLFDLEPLDVEAGGEPANAELRRDARGRQPSLRYWDFLVH